MTKNVIISCPTLKKELQQLIQEYKVDTPVYFIPGRLHSNPKELHEYLQYMIDNIYNTERITLCISGCGGSTIGLYASTAELVIAKTKDCIDILLSNESLSTLQRPAKGIFLTESWMDFMKNSSIDFETLIKKIGQAEAEKYLKKLYNGFKDFYIIETGAYDTKTTEEYILPLVRLLDGNLTKIHGSCEILRKIITGQFDQDFIIIPRGKTLQ